MLLVIIIFLKNNISFIIIKLLKRSLKILNIIIIKTYYNKDKNIKIKILTSLIRN